MGGIRAKPCGAAPCSVRVQGRAVLSQGLGLLMKALSNPMFRHLFAAQIVGLVGTGLATVALGLLAWELAGEGAGAVLGTALAIKMVAYVTLAPVAAALAERLPRRAFDGDA